MARTKRSAQKAYFKRKVNWENKQMTKKAGPKSWSVKEHIRNRRKGKS
jgi:hypothetical protein